MGKEKQNLMLISNPLKSCKNTHAKKVINEKVTEKLSFLLLLLSEKVVVL
jgi:hypothetical protein